MGPRVISIAGELSYAAAGFSCKDEPIKIFVPGSFIHRKYETLNNFLIGKEWRQKAVQELHMNFQTLQHVRIPRAFQISSSPPKQNFWLVSLIFP